MRKNLPRVLFALSALALSTLFSYIYLMQYLEELHLDQTTLRELTVTQTRCVLYLDGEASIGLRFEPVTADTRITWTSSDETVATVEGYGHVRAVGVGEAVLTAVGTPGIEASIPVIVIEKQLPPDSGFPPLYEDKILIVNKDTPISAEYIPEHVSAGSFPVNQSGLTAGSETLEAYRELYDAAYEATGQKLILCSGYRSYYIQELLYTRRIAELVAQGYSEEAAAAKVEEKTMPPGCSEHQLGNSLDMSNTGSLATFEGSKLWVWVTAHAHEYGFIQRYTEEKYDITKIKAEAWHFRYVGVGHAAYIYEHGLCLEEYVGLQAQAAEYIEEYCAATPAEELYDLLQQ